MSTPNYQIIFFFQETRLCLIKWLSILYKWLQEFDNLDKPVHKLFHLIVEKVSRAFDRCIEKKMETKCIGVDASRLLGANIKKTVFHIKNAPCFVPVFLVDKNFINRNVLRRQRKHCSCNEFSSIHYFYHVHFTEN